MRFARVFAVVLLCVGGSRPVAAALRAQAAADPMPAGQAGHAAAGSIRPGLSSAAGQAGQGHSAEPHPLHLDIVRNASGGWWCCGCCWRPARPPGWRRGRRPSSGRRWIQGLLFFAAFFVITALASLPLDMIGHTVEPPLRHQRAGLGKLVRRPGQRRWD